MSGTYNRTESYMDWEQEQDQDMVEREEREEHTKFIRNRRRLVLMSVVLIFLLTTVVMVTSVVYVEMNKDVVGYMECAENDSLCIDYSCPVGWSLNTEDHCNKMSGFSCCSPGHFVCGEQPHVTCYPSTSQPDWRSVNCSCVLPEILSSGVSMSGYKQVCRPQFIWVDWRQKCLRKN